jgi:hypothetical protein
LAGCGVVVEGFGGEDVGAISADRQTIGGEVGGSSGGAEEGGRAVMGTDVVEGVLWGW